MFGDDGRNVRPIEAWRPDELDVSFSPPINTIVGLPAVEPNFSAKRCRSVFAHTASDGRMTDSPSITTGIAITVPVVVAAPTGMV